MNQDEPLREPTMDEILASIRRIISEEEAAAQTPSAPEAGVASASVDFTQILELTHALPSEPQSAPTPTPTPTPTPAAGLGTPDIGLEALVRSLLEPHLKAWLDAHLPDMVEKMVAAEIARIGQKTPD